MPHDRSLNIGVIVDGPDGFITDVLPGWRSRFRVETFSFTPLAIPFSEHRVNKWLAARALRRFFRRSDVVFFEWAGPILAFASHLAGRAPVVVRLHSYELFDQAPSVNWQAVRHVVLVSRAMQRRFLAAYPEMTGRTSVICNGVNLEAFGRSRRSHGRTIGMLCNLVPVKRVYEVILAAHAANAQGADLTLRIGGSPGDGPEAKRYHTALTRLVSDLDLGQRVIFEGRIDDAPDFLQGIDVFVSNSYWEGQQVALLEAMAAGCHCLSHRWEGAEEVLPEDCLFASEGQLVQKILAFCALSETERTDRQARLRQIAAHAFDGRDMTQHLAQVIEDCASGARERRTNPLGSAVDRQPAPGTLR